MPKTLKGWIKPRPIRVAFLIEDGDHSSLTLDGIFADCYSRWGGRFSLIVPCVDKKISSEYWDWLERYDADLIYSYVELGKEEVLQVHERLSPSQYYVHDMGPNPRLDLYGFKPAYGVRPLSSLSTIFRHARYGQSRYEKGPIKIIDSWHTEDTSRLLLDNFGTYHTSSNTGMFPSDALHAAGLLTVVSPKFKAERQYGVPRDLVTIPNETAAVHEFAIRGATSLSTISASLSQKLDIRSPRWSNAFNLVVGNSYLDRLLFWNARLMIPHYLDSELCCFRIELEQLEDPEFVEALVLLLINRNFVNAGGSDPKRVVIRSATHSEEELERLKGLLSENKIWSLIDIEVISNLSELVPSYEQLRNARIGRGFAHVTSTKKEWTEFSWSPPKAKLPNSLPEQFLDSPAKQTFMDGFWAVDLSLECDSSYSVMGNTNRWKLSKRWRMGEAFKSTTYGGGIGRLPPEKRSNQNGDLVLMVAEEHPIENIDIPSPLAAIRYSLVSNGAFVDEEDIVKGWIGPKAKLAWIEPSNEAHYLAGVLGMAGGLVQARQYFLHPFLKGIFAKFGATPSIAESLYTSSLNAVGKVSKKQSAFDLSIEHDKKVLARLIAKAARQAKKPDELISYKEIKLAWKEYCNSYWKEQPNCPWPAVIDEDEQKKREVGYLDNCLQDLRQKEIVFQGHRWTCKKCYHKNWIDLLNISPRLSCEVCKESELAPIDIRWLFRLNEFLLESIRNRSTLSLIWALSALHNRSRYSFIFVESVCLGFKTEKGTPDAEADLLVLSDGNTILCEVKSSWRNVNNTSIEEFEKIALKLRPDIAIFAVMENQPGGASPFVGIQQRLKEKGIGFETLTTDTYEVQDDPSLQRFG